MTLRLIALLALIMALLSGAAQAESIKGYDVYDGCKAYVTRVVPDNLESSAGICVGVVSTIFDFNKTNGMMDELRSWSCAQGDESVIHWSRPDRCRLYGQES